MRTALGSWSGRRAIGLCLVFIACAGPKEKPLEAPADAPSKSSQLSKQTTRPVEQAPLPALRTGVVPPREIEGVELGEANKVRSHALGDFVDIVFGDDFSPADHIYVSNVDGALPVQLYDKQEDKHHVIVRLPRGSSPPEVIEGTMWRSRSSPVGQEWTARTFSADLGRATRKAPAPVVRQWAEGFGPASGVVSQPRTGWSARSHAWMSFARKRLATMATKKKRLKPSRREDERGGELRRSHGLAELMGTVSGAASIQESLQLDRGLRLRRETRRRELKLSSLKPPALAPLPFHEMQAALPKGSTPNPEPLAELTPADFWYLRFRDVRVMLESLEELEDWVTPAVRLMEGNAEDYALSHRYQGELALRRSELARLFGDRVIAEVAVVGSDPYIREGSDLSFIFRVKLKTVFDAVLSQHLSSWKSEVNGVVRSEKEYRGHSLLVDRDSTGRVRRHRVDTGEFVIVSNSEAALQRILDTIDKRSKSLAGEPDFRYLRARDPGEHDALAFLSDSFIASVVGPAQKIKEMRRHVALAELLTPGYAAMLYGWLEGEAPTDVASLTRRGYLRPDELKHGDGWAIAFDLKAGASSKWGRPSALMPLIEIADPLKISEAEAETYRRFAGGYQDSWSDYIDPVAVVMDLDKEGDLQTAKFHTRILPLIQNSEYDQIEGISGAQRIEVPPIQGGFRLAFALGQDASVRSELDGLGGMLGGSGALNLRWLGAWVAIGCLDRNEIASLALQFLEDIQVPPTVELAESLSEREIAGRTARHMDAFARIPLYGMIDVANPTGLVAMLAALRVGLNSVAPGQVSWQEVSKHREVPIVRIGPSASVLDDQPFASMKETIGLHYAQVGGKLLLALREDVLQRLIEASLAGEGPKAVKESGAQYVLDLDTKANAGLWTAVTWMLQSGVSSPSNQRRSRMSAEILLRGIPATRKDPALFDELARAYFGPVPLTASGQRVWTLHPEGAGDPVHGTEISRIYPKIPVPNSPVAELMRRVRGVRGRIAFDNEPGPSSPPTKSLVAKFEVSFAG